MMEGIIHTAECDRRDHLVILEAVAGNSECWIIEWVDIFR